MSVYNHVLDISVYGKEDKLEIQNELLQEYLRVACLSDLFCWYNNPGSEEYFKIKFTPDGDKSGGITTQQAARMFEKWMDVLTRTKLFKNHICNHYLSRYDYIFWFSDSFLYNKAIVAFIRFGFEMEEELRKKIYELLESEEITEDQAVYIPVLLRRKVRDDSRGLWVANEGGHNIVCNHDLLGYKRYQVIQALSGYLNHCKKVKSMDSASEFQKLATSFVGGGGDSWLNVPQKTYKMGWICTTTMEDTITLLRNMPNEL